MRSDPLLRSFVLARNKVVKETGLVSKSTFKLGLFKGRRMKFAAETTPPLMTESVTERERLRASSFAALVVLPDRSTIGEQLGVGVFAERSRRARKTRGKQPKA
jgi:hypothetical protein